MKKILFLVVIIFIAGLFVFLIKDNNLVKKYVFRNSQQESNPTKKNYVPGEIMLGFTDDAPYSEVIQAIESENLTYENTYKAFEPSSLVSVPAGQAQIFADKLKQNKLVSEIIPNETRNEIEVKFAFGTSKTDVEGIIKQEGLTMINFFRFPYIKVKTPEGKEQFYIDKFKKLPIVKSAELNHLFYVQ
jgi:hypothetical protein